MRGGKQNMDSERSRQTEELQDALFQTTIKWMATLPRNIQPRSLAKEFPRITKEIAKLWDDPSSCGKLIDSLLFDTRSGRREGFPYQVAFELSYLKALIVFRTTHPELGTLKEEINIRRPT
jgi:hypothetical protein